MKKKTKLMTTMGIMGACACAGAATYMYMQNNKKKMQQRLKKYMNMTYPENQG